MKRVGIVTFRLADDREVEIDDEHIVLVDQREIDSRETGMRNSTRKMVLLALLVER